MQNAGGASMQSSPCRLEMCAIRTHPFAAPGLFFLFVCLERMFSTPPPVPPPSPIPPAPVHPNWVTINGPIVKVSGCSSSSRGLQTQIGEEGVIWSGEGLKKWELNSSAHCLRVWKMAPWQPHPVGDGQRARGTGTRFSFEASPPCWGIMFGKEEKKKQPRTHAAGFGCAAGVS